MTVSRAHSIIGASYLLMSSCTCTVVSSDTSSHVSDSIYVIGIITALAKQNQIQSRYIFCRVEKDGGVALNLGIFRAWCGVVGTKPRRQGRQYSSRGRAPGLPPKPFLLGWQLSLIARKAARPPSSGSAKGRARGQVAVAVTFERHHPPSTRRRHFIEIERRRGRAVDGRTSTSTCSLVARRGSHRRR